MRRDRHLIRTMLLSAAWAAAVLAIVLVGGGALLWSTLADAERQTLLTLLLPRGPLLLLAVLVALGATAALAVPWYRRWMGACARLLERSRSLRVGVGDAPNELRIPGAAPAVQDLAHVMQELALQRDQLRRDRAQEVAQASRGVAQERNRLAALMSELSQSVVVCNLDGRILLYNHRARLQFRTLSDAPTLAGGAELIGLGRSIYTVFDRKLVAHAIESVQQRLQRGVANPSAQFVTATRSGQLLRAQLAPVRGVAPAPPSAPAGPDVAPDATPDTTAPEAAAVDANAPITGFVLMLDNITHEYEQESARERVLHGLTEGSRGSLANLRAAAEMLDDAALGPDMRERFLRVVRDEAQAMSRRIDDLAQRNAQGLATRWPLDEMLGADFVQAAQRRIEAITGSRTGTAEIEPSLWLKVDSFSLLQSLAYLAQRLRDEFSVKTVHLRLSPAEGPQARLDLVWSGQAMSTETVMNWETDPLATGGEASSLTLRDVVQRHGGAFWFERDRVRHQAFFRFLLPLAPTAAAQARLEATFSHSDSRPEYYDFDLFASTESTHALDDRRLVDLTYTVFDTETTGLRPTEGDEVIQIGAARLVNGKLLRSECFEQLVDPRRSIPALGIPIHGITPEMVAGQPVIDEVLPAFHAYARDTVLVAHNAAFDMRFLQLKEERTGLRFDQPVLDTLLLSALVHPHQDSHQLEAIAERFGIAVIGRHTALGDALVTAEVFLRLIPLLAEQGIHTLGQAREAAQKTYYARLTY